MEVDKRDLKLAGILTLFAAGIATVMALSPDKEAQAGPKLRPCFSEGTTQEDYRGYFMPLESIMAPYELNGYELQTIQDANGIDRTDLPFELENGILYCTVSIADKIQNMLVPQSQAPEQNSTESDISNVVESNNSKKTFNVLDSEGKDITFYLSYYDPGRGGINCDHDCTTTGSGRKVLNASGQPVGGWWDPKKGKGWVACPSQFPYGTTFDILVPGGEEIEFMCVDRGGAIVIKDNQKVILDILYDDGFNCNDGRGSQCDRFGGPSAANGVKLSGNFKGAYNLPDSYHANK